MCMHIPSRYRQLELGELQTTLRHCSVCPSAGIPNDHEAETYYSLCSSANCSRILHLLPSKYSLVPRPCAFVACSKKFAQNSILQATNAQGLGTRLLPSSLTYRIAGDFPREKTSGDCSLLPRQRTPHPKFRRENFRV